MVPARGGYAEPTLFSASSSAAAVRATLQELKAAAATERNLMPLLLDTARVHASEGEIVLALQEVWGDYRERPFF